MIVDNHEHLCVALHLTYLSLYNHVLMYSQHIAEICNFMVDSLLRDCHLSINDLASLYLSCVPEKIPACFLQK